MCGRYSPVLPKPPSRQLRNWTFLPPGLPVHDICPSPSRTTRTYYYPLGSLAGRKIRPASCLIPLAPRSSLRTMHFRNSSLTNKVSARHKMTLVTHAIRASMLTWGVTANRVLSSLTTMRFFMFVAQWSTRSSPSLAHYSPGDNSQEHYRKVHSSQLAIIKGWKRLCLELSASMYPTGGPILDAFWRTAFLDCIVLKVR